MQLDMFTAAVPRTRQDPDDVARLLTELWPERAPWRADGEALVGLAAVVLLRPLEIGGYTGLRRWVLADARMSPAGAIREARLRSLELPAALQDVTGWSWVAMPGEDCERAIVHVAGETNLLAWRGATGVVSVRVVHPAETSCDLRLPVVRGYLGALDLSLERLRRLIPPGRGAWLVVADLDHAIEVGSAPEACAAGVEDLVEQLRPGA